MNHEKIVQDFIKNQTEGWAEEDFPAMEQALLENRDRILDSLTSALRTVCSKANELQAAGEKGPAAVIGISFLRTNIMDNIWRHRVDLYDERGFRDPVECCAGYTLDFVWQYLWKRLDKVAVAAGTGLYRNKVRPVHLEWVKQRMAEEYNVAATVITKAAIRDAIRIPEYKALKKAPDLKIIMGEYGDAGLLLYAEQPGQEPA
ncbi:Hypothetical protein LUCI_2385 [Lucifera butyrica]|uniref:Uncharacterized protein n=1 Tax=Lucifera butyrica TaxID=1351585 RepID=A0A498R707_9FIRM|nr:hypothetical protein [Lucifera butyrica]VBB07141.1 Hypothetical protein LUCI_2385 [Lucifera butyrica]